MAAAANEFEVVRDTTISAPRSLVFALLADFRRWAEWSPWEDVDPNLWRGYSGAESGVGAIYEWAGNRKAGAGRMEIMTADAPSLVRLDLQFLKPFKSRNTTTFTLDDRNGGTHVTWRMVGPKTFTTRDGPLHEHGQDGGNGLREGPRAAWRGR